MLVKGKNKAIFLDRDGCINEDAGYFHEAEKLKFCPNAIEGLKKMPKGYKLVVVQNQSGIGLGIFTTKDSDAVNERICKILANEGVVIEAFYRCPHKPADGCKCRKPKPHLVMKAAEDFRIDLNKSWIIGDSTCDVLLAEIVRELGYKGFRSIGVLTGYALKDGRFDSKPDFYAKDLAEAAEIIGKC